MKKSLKTAPKGAQESVFFMLHNAYYILRPYAMWVVIALVIVVVMSIILTRDFLNIRPQ
jgi:hypothetical protein